MEIIKIIESTIKFDIYTPAGVEHVNVGDLVYMDYNGVIHLYNEDPNT